MIDLTEPVDVYEHVIHYDEVKQEQVRVFFYCFGVVVYLHIRKYYMDFTEEWKPTPTGIAMPLDFNNSKELFRALTEIIS